MQEVTMSLGVGVEDFNADRVKPWPEVEQALNSQEAKDGPQ